MSPVLSKKYAKCIIERLKLKMSFKHHCKKKHFPKQDLWTNDFFFFHALTGLSPPNDNNIVKNKEFILLETDPSKVH